MFRAIAATQWKSTRTTALLAAVAAFSLPIAALQAARGVENAQMFINIVQGWSAGYALLAAGAGLLLALAAWGPDHQGRHVYALSLPISRSRYAMLRFGAGALFIGPIALALFFGALTVIATGAIPQGLHAYPFALTLRFLFAALVAYAIFFAIGAATTRTAAVILGAIGALLFAQFLLYTLDVDFNLLERVGELIFGNPGILSVFSGRWTLIDV